MAELKTPEQWTCKGREGSGCGFKYESPLPIESVSHKCTDGERRHLTQTRKGIKR